MQGGRDKLVHQFHIETYITMYRNRKKIVMPDRRINLILQAFSTKNPSTPLVIGAFFFIYLLFFIAAFKCSIQRLDHDLLQYYLISSLVLSTPGSRGGGLGYLILGRAKRTI